MTSVTRWKFKTTRGLHICRWSKSNRDWLWTKREAGNASVLNVHVHNINLTHFYTWLLVTEIVTLAFYFKLNCFQTLWSFPVEHSRRLSTQTLSHPHLTPCVEALRWGWSSRQRQDVAYQLNYMFLDILVAESLVFTQNAGKTMQFEKTCPQKIWILAWFHNSYAYTVTCVFFP